jgi:hypothetical protein
MIAGGALSLAGLSGCSSDTGSDPGGSEGDVGNIGLELQLAPGVTVNTVSWTVSNVGNGFTRSGSVNVQFSNTVSFQVGGLPAGSGYSIALTATSVDGSFTCSGSASFSVMAGTVSSVNVNLACSAAPGGNGSVAVHGTTQICANIDALSVSPLETTVNNPIALSASATAGSIPPTFAWTATSGTFDNAASATPIFTCPATPDTPTITLTVSPNGPGCTTVTSQSVTVICDTLNPTFTNMYTNVIASRCTSCHQPGRSGVTVGMLDMSTPAVAYASLVGVAAAGTGAGTSGVTCASAMSTRVVPGNTVASLLFNKVNSKLLGVNPVCGSPMPLPATAAPLTAAQVDLIGAWIAAGAMND